MLTTDICMTSNSCYNYAASNKQTNTKKCPTCLPMDTYYNVYSMYFRIHTLEYILYISWNKYIPDIDSCDKIYFTGKNIEFHFKTCVYMCVHICTWTCIRKPEVNLKYYYLGGIHLNFWDRVSLWPENCKQAGWPDWALGICLSLLPWLWEYKHMPLQTNY